MQRNKAMRELAPLVSGAGPFKDDEILPRYKTFDEANQRALQEIRQAELELDGVLTPWQRVRFRMLEERLERQKIEMLVKLRGVRDGGVSTTSRQSGRQPGVAQALTRLLRQPEPRPRRPTIEALSRPALL